MISESIRVVLVDDHSVVRAGLKAVLGATPDITVVGEASNGREAVELVARVKPDVVVMDLSMPGLDGVAATKEIVASGVGARVIILSMHAEEDYLVPGDGSGSVGISGEDERRPRARQCHSRSRARRGVRAIGGGSGLGEEDRREKPGCQRA